MSGRWSECRWLLGSVNGDQLREETSILPVQVMLGFTQRLGSAAADPVTPAKEDERMNEGRLGIALPGSELFRVVVGHVHTGRQRP